MKTIIVIPARLESTRLPRKLLLNETGQPLIQHTWERACLTELPVVIATDNDEIIDHASRFGARCVRTRTDHNNGTERAAEAASKLDDLQEHADVVIVWQADEPDVKLNSHQFFSAINSVADVVTLHTSLSPEQNQNTNCVKIVHQLEHVIYCTRRPAVELPWMWKYVGHHIGIYAIRRDALDDYCCTAPPHIEEAERLEQLRWFYMGRTVKTVYAVSPGGVNTREDYDAFVARHKELVQG